MKISELTLHNFKCFEGQHSLEKLDTVVSDNQPIILFGGLNGTGKTTLFESILLCLYGRKNTTLWPSKGAKRESYDSYILSVTNNNAKSKKPYGTELWIQVNFSEVDIGGMKQSFTIKRRWVVASYKNKVEEVDLEIMQNGQAPSFAPDEYEYFIQSELIPQNIAKFFLFDGEKIQDFIKDEDEEFEESFEAVLGISLYKQLKDDLINTRSRIVTNYNQDKNIELELHQTQGELIRLERDIHDNKESKGQAQSEIYAIQDDITKIDAQTKRLTSLDAHTQQEYENQKEALSIQKGVLEEKIFQLTSNIPFVMLSGLGQKLNKQLGKEQNFIDSQVAYQKTQKKISTIVENLFQGKKPKIPLIAEQEKFYREKLKNILQSTFAVESQPLLLHQISQNNFYKIKQKLQQAYSISESLEKDIDALQKVEYEFSQIRKAERGTVDSESKGLYEERGRLKEKIQVLETNIEQYKVNITNYEEQVAANKRKQTNLENKVEKTKEMEKQLKYTDRLIATIDDFSKRFRARKVELLEALTLEMLTQLIRKEEFVSRIEIDPSKYFSITLYDVHERIVDKTKLSAGEKEILAISLIWALSQLTSRSLPIIIDTPLGRLDSKHRNNIVKKYFTQASHQVLILSSDEEITGKEYASIKPYVSKQFIIEEGMDSESSIIREGYFSNGS